MTQARSACWSRVFFVREGERREGKICLEMPESIGDGLYRTQVTFEGSDVAPATGVGDSELAAARDALHRRSIAIEALRASGGEVLQPTGMTYRDSGFSPAGPLEDWARITLRRLFGEAEPPLPGTVVKEPVPVASGHVEYVVSFHGRLVSVYQNQNGMGAACSDLVIANEATRIVYGFLDDRDESERFEWIREAARMRRAAGGPPDIVPRASTRIRIVGEPRITPGGVWFDTAGAAVEIRVIVSKTGCVMDDCPDWSLVTEDDRDEAMGAVVHHLLADPSGTASLGLDPELLAEFYT